MPCHCQIIPNDVLERLAKDKKLSATERKAFADTAAVSAKIRAMRVEAGKFTAVSGLVAPLAIAAEAATVTAPVVTVADCQHSQSLPGVPIANPASSADGTIKRAAVETRAVADFFRQVFGRNSIDNAGMTLASSVHFGVDFNNAFWNGLQMTYGDGDNNIFVDFTLSNDVIAHELTHGVTQHTLQLAYRNQAGGLNESLSDVFGSMFRQWRADQTVDKADWLIGKEIMGPAARARNFTCLRDMARPGAAHCLAPQPFHFSDYATGMDPHQSSGIPNLAFYTAAKAIGGKAWLTAGQIWYKTMTNYGASPNMTMRTFANRTRKIAAQLYPADASVAAAVKHGWATVGL